MNRKTISKFFKLSVIFLGGASLLYALSSLDARVSSWHFAVLALFTAIIAPKMNLTLPRSRFALSFSDSMIFLTFLLYGGEAAIVMATIEMSVYCFYLRRDDFPFGQLMIPTNIAAAALSTTITFFVWLIFPVYTGINPTSTNTTSLISVLGILAISQFLAQSVYAAIIESLKQNVDFFKVWKENCFSVSTTQIAGAGLAGIIFKLVNYADYLTIGISLVVLAVAYINYRQMIAEVNQSIEQAEDAQREKAAAESQRAEQAESHVDELNVILDELRQSKDQFQYAALHDSLTKVANRAFLIEKLEFLLEMSKSNPAAKFHVLFADLHRFKNVNDSLGHGIGDKILILVAKRLLRAVNPEDTVARLGGDEFAIILSDPVSVPRAEELAREIYDKLSQPFAVRGNRIFTKLHVGIAALDADYQSPEEILRDADIAMHHAKDLGVPVAMFDKQLRSRFLENVTLESDLRFAVQRGELSMYYQPLISLNDGELVGFEALLRWQHPRRGFISPAQFIPIAEESGIIIPITEWILKQTTHQLAEWQKIAPDYEKLLVSVNISGKHMAVDGLVEQVEKVLKSSKIKPVTLKLEITESTAMQNAERTIEILTDLKKIGVQLSIDDFGTGYSSLSQLHRLPFDTLKIDRSFVYSVGDNGENSEILQTVVSLSKNLKMKAIAEGIETENQLQLLRNLGCDYGQGYLFSKPLPKDEMETLLYQHHFWFPQTMAGDISHSKDLHEQQQTHVF